MKLNLGIYSHQTMVSFQYQCVYFIKIIAFLLTILLITQFTLLRVEVLRWPYNLGHLLTNMNNEQKDILNSQVNDTLSELRAEGWNCSFKSRRSWPGKDSLDDARKVRYDGNVIGFLIPNVVHYVWLGKDLTLKFVHYISFLGVHRYIAPRYIFVYGETGPTGYWWNRTVQDVDNIVHVYRESRLHAPSGKLFKYKAHDSDVLRTEIIYSK